MAGGEVVVIVVTVVVIGVVVEVETAMNVDNLVTLPETAEADEAVVAVEVVAVEVIASNVESQAI